VPIPLTLETFDGRCWIGVVPFRISGIHARGLPPLPGLSRFPELNVRTYETHGGKSGVYFFSLDAANLPAVWAARKFFHLPYFHAALPCEEGNRVIHYSSRRRHASAEFRGRYRPMAPAQPRDRGWLERWLTERYCFYALHNGAVCGGEIHHQLWPLQAAEAEREINIVAAAAGTSLPETAPSLLFARRLEVLIWPLRRADSPSVQI
jgi:uncharacterized protein YqjF (DUF2071 family)